MKNECSLDLSTIVIPPDWTRYPLPGDLMLPLLAGEISVIAAVRRWVNTADDMDANLADIKKLASSISVVGLTEAIQITADRTLVSGLRRLLAHAYLVVAGETAYNRIEAIIVEGNRSLSAQLSETLVREDLTAVETALNVALLIAAIERQTVEAQPPYVHPDGTIAVPTDLRELLHKRRGYGTWNRITAMLGKTDRRWRQFVDLLNLCDRALTLAHRVGMTEWQLREVVRENLGCAEQIEYIQWIIAGKPREEEEEEEEEEKTESASPAAIASVRKIVSACDHLSTYNPDALESAVAKTFAGLTPADFEDSYEVFDLIYRTLQGMRDWHKGEDKQEESQGVRHAPS
jgi:hypothetical protein